MCLYIFLACAVVCILSTMRRTLKTLLISPSEASKFLYSLIKIFFVCQRMHVCSCYQFQCPGINFDFLSKHKNLTQKFLSNLKPNGKNSQNANIRSNFFSIGDCLLNIYYFLCCGLMLFQTQLSCVLMAFLQLRCVYLQHNETKH